MIPTEHFGKRSYSVDCTRRFKDGKEFDAALEDYCEKKGYVCKGPGDDSPQAKATLDYMEKSFKSALGTDKDLRFATVGLDSRDSKRITVLWAAGYNNVFIHTFCGIGTYAEDKDVDYTDLAREFAQEFFGGLTFTYFEEPGIEI